MFEYRGYIFKSEDFTDLISEIFIFCNLALIFILFLAGVMVLYRVMLKKLKQIVEKRVEKRKGECNGEI